MVMALDDVAPSTLGKNTTYLPVKLQKLGSNTKNNGP